MTTYSEFYEEYGHLSKEELSDQLLGFCDIGQLKEVKYVLTSPELKEHADINYLDDAPLKWACYKNRLEVVKYLLTSNELKKHANISAENDEPFSLALQRGNINIIEYFIFDQNIPKSEHIIKHLNALPYFKEKIDKMFLVRDSNNQLNIELPINSNMIKKSAKI